MGYFLSQIEYSKAYMFLYVSLFTTEKNKQTTLCKFDLNKTNQFNLLILTTFT